MGDLSTDSSQLLQANARRAARPIVTTRAFSASMDRGLVSSLFYTDFGPRQGFRSLGLMRYRTVNSMGQRRALLIGTPFFGYYQHIIAGLVERGFTVDYYNDRPTENPVVKGAIRVRPGLVNGRVIRYLDEIVASTSGRNYDLVLTINGKIHTPDFVARLRARHPHAEFVFYLWDAVSLYPHTLDFLHLMDRCYTFDRADAERYPQLGLLPLFYIPPYGTIGAATPPPATYDLASICTAHANRYAVLKPLVPQLEAAGLRVFDYRYLHPLRFVYERTRAHGPLHKATTREFTFRSLAPERVHHVVKHSVGVLDINHEAQTGLTMRTIETVGARRKLVTTNAESRRYTFFDPSRVLVIDSFDANVPEIVDFLHAPMEPLPTDVYATYSMSHWLDVLTGKESAADAQVFLR